MENRTEIAQQRETDSDPVDWFAREILKHPDQAEALKRTLRNRLDDAPAGVPARDSEDPYDAEEFWDNVPV